jgi:hypothetical protein
MTSPVSVVLAAASLAFAFHPLTADAQEAAAVCAALPARPATRLPAVIPIEIHNNHVLVRVCRRSTPLTFTLDTGAPFSIFDLTIARQLGVGIESNYRANGGGPGTAAAARTREDAVVIPGALVTVPITNAIDFSSLAASGNELQGILGADFLSRFIVAIDYNARELRLFDRATFSYDGRGTTVPFTLRGNYIFVNGEVGLADGARIPGEFVVDVGSSLALSLAKPFVEEHRLRERVGTTVRRPGGRGVGGVSTADVGRVTDFRIGDVILQRPIVHLYGDSSGVFAGRTLGDGNVGADILRRFTVYFDYAKRRMIFEPHAGTAEPFEADMSGLQLAATGTGSGLSVDFVVARSPAGELGFAKGDTVVAVDGEAVTALKLDPLRRRLRRENETVKFTVRRNGSPRVLTLVTRRLV